MSKNSPSPPDYKGAATAEAAQSQANTAAQTQANRPNITTNTTSQQWTQGPDGQWSLNAQLSPEARAAQLKANSVDFSKLGPIDDGSKARDQAITGAYNQASMRLNPQFAQADAKMRSRLAAQGLDPNSQAARGAESQLSANKNDAYSSAMNSAIAQGTAAGDSSFRNSMSAPNQQLAEMLKSSGLDLENLQKAKGLMDTPQFKGADQAKQAELLKAMAAGDMAAVRQWELDNKAQSDFYGGLFGLGGDLIGMGKPL